MQHLSKNCLHTNIFTSLQCCSEQQIRNRLMFTLPQKMCRRNNFIFIWSSHYYIMDAKERRPLKRKQVIDLNGIFTTIHSLNGTTNCIFLSERSYAASTRRIKLRICARALPSIFYSRDKLMTFI